ncbi:MAG TPA: hypothetical protein VKQ36_02180 [Ktedonobacterales bacterium]|nr:hypothetical protein [Ktedonobacterales bacterium]
MKRYQAVFSRPDNIARVQAARRAIERVGGKVEIIPSNAGMTAVILTLPEPYRPEQFVPGLPFFPL